MNWQDVGYQLITQLIRLSLTDHIRSSGMTSDGVLQGPMKGQLVASAGIADAFRRDVTSSRGSSPSSGMIWAHHPRMHSVTRCQCRERYIDEAMNYTTKNRWHTL